MWIHRVAKLLLYDVSPIEMLFVEGEVGDSVSHLTF
jgi:hypothetical protein